MKSSEQKKSRKVLKKLVPLALAAALLVSVSACSQSAGGGDEVYNGKLEFTWDGDLTASDVTKADSLRMLTATDDFGRTFEPVAGVKEDKDRYVGLFYFLWQGQHSGQQQGIYDISAMLENGDEELWDTQTNSVSPVGQYHYWGEPLYGYYNSTDEWVLRKHIELLTLAGVDFLVFDVTNGFEYFDVLNVLLPIMQEYYDAGWDVPKFMFYTNSNSAEVVRRLYEGYETDIPSQSDIYNDGIYKDGRYKDLWFAPNGKPMIVAITEDNGGASDQGSSAALTEADDADLLEFFEIKESQWPNTGVNNENGFPWVEFSRPNSAFGDVINVSVAQHNKLPFSDAALSAELADEMWGRGYTSANGADHSNTAINSGLNFEEQWDNAIATDVTYTFVTGWNEWIALKQVGAPGNGSYLDDGNYTRSFFVDTFNREYSRDVEMMKDGYFDNFYLQMARNIRDLKTNPLTEITYADHKTIDIAAGLTQWNGVKNVYYDFSGETIARDSIGMSSSVSYTDTTNRNDIEEVRVAEDDNYIYFLVQCKDNIQVDLEGGNWMNILISVNGSSDAGWNGYNFIVNRSPEENGLTTVEKLTAAGSTGVSYQSSGSAYVTVNGRYMQYRIPKTSLGISGEYRIDFKVLDNVSDLADLSTYYTTGDACPAGRMNYAYYGK